MYQTNGTTLYAVVLLLGLSSTATAQPATLGLQEAEAAALSDDPVEKGLRLKADGLRDQAVAEGQLPDPKLKLGLMNFPTDTFDRDQEPMTQIQVGVQQAFPRGDTLAYKAQRVEALAEGQDARAVDQKNRLLRDVRSTWLETYYWSQAAGVVRETHALFRKLVGITESYYAAGLKNQQDVLRAELELGLLKDRETRILAMEDVQRARLAEWIGTQMARRPLPEKVPALAGPGSIEDMLAGLEQHPLMEVEQARVDADQQTVAMAREAYKPGWMLDVTYGFRDGDNPNGSDRADFLSAMVMLDMPIFTDKRQNRRLSASQQHYNASLLSREERMRQLRRMLNEAHVEWLRLGERAAQYGDSLLPQARANAEAALAAYQSDEGDFTALVRARITELETRLKALRISVDRAKVHARLLYMAGDVK